MANNALIQGAGQMYRAQGAKTLAMGSGMAKGGTAVVEEYFKQKEEKDKTDKQNASLAAIYQQTAVNEQGFSERDFAQIQKETQAHNQMIIDLSKQGLDPTLYQATLTNKTRELEGRLKTINNIAATRTMANGLVRTHGDEKIGMKLSEHFRATEDGILTEKVVNALANGEYQYGKENGVIIIDGERYNQTQIKERVDNYKSGMYNVFEAGGVRAGLIDSVMKLETPQDLKTWKNAQEKMYNWKNPAVISKIKKELTDVWEQDAEDVNKLTDEGVKNAWLKTRTDLADEFAKITTPTHPGKQLFENINNQLDYELATGGIVSYLKDNSGSIEYEGGRLIARSETAGQGKNEVSLEPVYDSKNGTLTVWLADKDGETLRRQVTFNMNNARDRSYFTTDIAETQKYSKGDINKMLQYGTHSGMEGYRKSRQEISEIQNKVIDILGKENRTQEDLQYLKDNKVDITDKDKLDQINKEMKEYGMPPIKRLVGLSGQGQTTGRTGAFEGYLDLPKIENPSDKRFLRNQWLKNENYFTYEAGKYKPTGELKEYLDNLKNDPKFTGSTYIKQNGKIPDEVVKRPDFAEKFKEVYPANTYHDTALFGRGQQNIMGREAEMEAPARRRREQKEKEDKEYKLRVKMRAWDAKGDKNDDFDQLYKLLGGNYSNEDKLNQIKAFTKDGITLPQGARDIVLNNPDKFSDRFKDILGITESDKPVGPVGLNKPDVTPAFSPTVEEEVKEESEILPNSSGAIGDDFSIPKPTGNSRVLKGNEKVDAEKDANKEKWVNNKVEETKWYKKPVMQITTADGKPMGVEMRTKTTIPHLIKKGKTDYISHKIEYVNNKQVVTLYNEYGDIIAVLRQE